MKPLILDYTYHDYEKHSKPQDEWEYYVCPECNSDVWKIIHTDEYETSGQCAKCGWMDVVHDG